MLLECRVPEHRGDWTVVELADSAGKVMCYSCSVCGRIWTVKMGVEW
jgi:hypothetical protein